MTQPVPRPTLAEILEAGGFTANAHATTIDTGGTLRQVVERALDKIDELAARDPSTNVPIAEAAEFVGRLSAAMDRLHAIYTTTTSSLARSGWAVATPSIELVRMPQGIRTAPPPTPAGQH